MYHWEEEGKRKGKKGVAHSQISSLEEKEMDNWSTKVPDFHSVKPFTKRTGFSLM